MIAGIDMALAERVVDAVVEVFRVDRAELLGRRRPKSITDARQVAYYVLRETGFMSFPMIGKLMGDRDHATVIHGCASIALRARDSSVLREKIDQVRLLSMVRSSPCREFVAAYVDSRAVEFLDGDRSPADSCARLGCGWMRGLHRAYLEAAAPKRDSRRAA